MVFNKNTELQCLHFHTRMGVGWVRHIQSKTTSYRQGRCPHRQGGLWLTLFLSNGTLYSCFLVSWCWRRMRQSVDILTRLILWNVVWSAMICSRSWCRRMVLFANTRLTTASSCLWWTDVAFHPQEVVWQFSRKYNSMMSLVRLFFTYCTVILYTVTSQLYYMYFTALYLFFYPSRMYCRTTLYCDAEWQLHTYSLV